MGFITDLITEGAFWAQTNYLSRESCRRIGIPMVSSYDVVIDNEKDTEDESNNLSAYTKVHWDEKLE